MRVHVALIELAQPGVEVAAKRLEPRVRDQHGELRHAAHAAGADPRRRAPDARTAASNVSSSAGSGSTSASRGSSRGSAAPHFQAGGQPRRHVLAAVHRQVDGAGQQRVLDFLDEQALAADLRQRRVGEAVARGLDDDDLGLDAGALEQQRRDRACLHQRQRAAARAEPQGWPS